MTEQKSNSDFLAAFAAFAIVGSFLAGIGLFGYQAYIWLRASTWVPISVLSALRWTGMPWAWDPRDWLGLHRLLDILPLSLGIPALGLLVAGFLVAAIQR